MTKDSIYSKKIFYEFLSLPRTIGSVTPCSKALAEEIIKPISFSTASAIVEYGPGTGVFTKEILNNKKKDTVFFAIELNQQMFNLMQHRFPDVDIHNSSASEVDNHLENAGVKHVDAIVSGLPWAGFSDKQQDDILEKTFLVLREEGVFITFAYLHGLVLPGGIKFKKKIKRLFSQVTISPVVWENIPPAIVYTCTK
jgi:phosphatidylethanolamine/phosphatidyl-N-methylethanolamine N-methyltransferase